MSVILRPEIDKNGLLITSFASVAVCRAIKKVCGVSPKIKWVNDVYLNGKKVCGILTESLISEGKAEYIILGIGINVNGAEFPEDIKDIATSIEKETLKKQDKKGRTLKLLKGAGGETKIKSSKDFYTQRELVDVPIVGKITAGEPILAVENITDTFPIPIDFVGNSESFMLTVRGESMIEAGILDGDYILVKKQSDARNGEIVVALIGDEATVKTFYKEKDHIRLQPENSTMDPIIVPTCEILGKVAGVFRKM